MQRWTTLIVLTAITFLVATSANAFHHGHRGCGYGGCGYGGCGYGGYGWGGPYAYGGYRPYGYGMYPLVTNAGVPAFRGAVYSANYAAPGYMMAGPGYAPVRPYGAPSMPARVGNVAPAAMAPANGQPIRTPASAGTAPRAAASPAAIAQRP